jgi:hypothetical protein
MYLVFSEFTSKPISLLASNITVMRMVIQHEGDRHYQEDRENYVVGSLMLLTLQ